MKTSSRPPSSSQQSWSRRRWDRWLYGPRLAKQRAPKRLRDKQYIYGFGKLAYVIERHAESWQLLELSTSALIDTYKDREIASRMGAALAAHAPSAAIKGERERDTKHIEQIRKHQQAANRLRSRPNGGRFDGLTERKSGHPVNDGDGGQQ